MSENPSKLHLAVKKQVMVVDDEIINREILGSLLQDEYDTIFASDGREAMEQIRRHRDTLALVLLDLQMPVLSGMVVLKLLSEDAELSRIPVIVMTADQESEVACLDLGALDFIPKPYPRRDIVLARVRRIIELSEDRQIIHDTERDPLTGLYNRDYFYSYAETFDQHHRSIAMDAIVVDVNHFHMLNERYGRAYSDQVLRQLGHMLRENVKDSGGIVCRREADTFMLYCPHREDYRELMDSLSAGLEDGESAAGRVRLRMGVYPRADKTVDMEQRFDRAKTAADAVRSNYTQNVSIYDEELHKAELFSEQLVEEFDSAIRERQFKVYYQPKFDIRPETPILTSAEALVRWQHPKLGLVSPGVFIPLFESNGLISKLDNYVWAEAAAQVRRWKDRCGVSVPVSVNVSRMDMFDPALIFTFQRLLRENGLKPEELLLEITESAYTDDADFIISTVNALRALGMKVEMDDFGTGYSSLGMISHLPIDALKLDMTFIRSAFEGQGDVRMLELIIDIADYLGVPVIAEGVETREQVSALKTMGCDIVQGYYFSKPIPPEAFDAFAMEKKRQEERLEAADQPRPDRSEKNASAAACADGQPAFDGGAVTFARIAQALCRDYHSIYLVNTENDAFIEYGFNAEGRELRVERSGSNFFEKCRQNMIRLAHPDDLGKALAIWEKDRLMQAIEGGQPFSADCRLMLEDKPVCINCKAIRLMDDEVRQYIIIGVSNADAPTKRERPMKMI